MEAASVKDQGRRTQAGLVALACLLGTIPCCKDAAPTPDELAVRATFEAYRAAVVAKDGEAAAALVGPATVKYFAELLDLARHADREALEARRISDRMVALCARALFSADELAAFTPRSFLAAALRRGIVSEGAPGIDLGPVTSDGDAAHGTLLLDGETTHLQLRFEREGGAWRFDLVSLYDLLEDNLDGLPKQLGRPIDAWLLDAVAATVGRPISLDIWTPPLPRSAPTP